MLIHDQLSFAFLLIFHLSEVSDQTYLPILAFYLWNPEKSAVLFAAWSMRREWKVAKLYLCIWLSQNSVLTLYLAFPLCVRDQWKAYKKYIIFLYFWINVCFKLLVYSYLHNRKRIPTMHCFCYRFSVFFFYLSTLLQLTDDSAKNPYSPPNFS